MTKLIILTVLSIGMATLVGCAGGPQPCGPAPWGGPQVDAPY